MAQLQVVCLSVCLFVFCLLLFWENLFQAKLVHQLPTYSPLPSTDFETIFFFISAFQMQVENYCVQFFVCVCVLCDFESASHTLTHINKS